MQVLHSSSFSPWQWVILNRPYDFGPSQKIIYNIWIWAVLFNVSFCTVFYNQIQLAFYQWSSIFFYHHFTAVLLYIKLILHCDKFFLKHTGANLVNELFPFALWIDRPIRHGCNYNPHQSDKICSYGSISVG